MKQYIVFLFSLTVLGCTQNSTEDAKQQVCNLQNLNDTCALYYKDFTILNVEQVEKDDEGTKWNHPTNDEYRFVIQDNNSENINGVVEGSILLVYKNKELIEKFTDIKYLSKRHIPINFSQCELDWFKEEQNVVWWIEVVRLVNEKANILDRIAAKSPVNTTMLKFDMFREKCICYVSYNLNSKIEVKGSFKMPPLVGQVCN